MTLRRPVRTNRRSRRYGTLAAGCIALLVASSVAQGQGCPCAKRELSTIVKQADVIFVGTALAATTDSAVIGRQRQEVQSRLMFQVTAVLKGSTSRSTAVATPAGPCGFAFAVGTEYLVAGTKQGGGVVTDVCQGNVAGANAIQARVAAIREAMNPKAKQPAPSVAP